MNLTRKIALSMNAALILAFSPLPSLASDKPVDAAKTAETTTAKPAPAAKAPPKSGEKSAVSAPQKASAPQAAAQSASARPQLPIGDSPVIGAARARVTIVEISDYECPYCVRGNDVMKQLLAQYPNDVRVVMKQLPLSFHRHARQAAMAALAAGEQGKYWQMHDRLFESTRARIKLTRERLEALAQEIGLDMARFRAALDSEKFAAAINADARLAKALGVRGTPAFFVNGIRVNGAQPVENFKAIIDAELATK